MLIDFGSGTPNRWASTSPGCLGGDIQIGQQDADDLSGRAAACVASYVAGLADDVLADTRP